MSGPGAGAMIIERGRGRILLLRRSCAVPDPGLWNLPGGFLEPCETAAQAARRELAEEAGVTEAGARIRWAGWKISGPWRALVGYVPGPARVTLDRSESDGFGWFTAAEIIASPREGLHPSVVPLLGAQVRPL